MNWPNFLAPGWAAMGLIAIPIILLYILRQKRPDLPISSTLLWSKTLADMRASTPFQKLRRNLLLFLQLLILAALVFTLMRPVVQAQAGQSKAGVIVLDATASMQTLDGSGEAAGTIEGGGQPDGGDGGGGGGGGGGTRLDRAKAEAHKLVDAMRPGDRFMLIADGGGMAQVRSGFSSSKSELHSLIDTVRPSDTASDLSESLLLAVTSLRAIGAHGPEGATAGAGGGGGGGAGAVRGGVRSENIAAGKVYLFSDGAGVKVPEALGGSQGISELLQFVKVGFSDHSVGVSRLSITHIPKEPNTYQVFVGLKNAWNQERRVGVALAHGNRDNFLPGQAKFAVLPPNGQGSVVFEKVVADPGRLYIRVDENNDDFPLDNTAYGILTADRKLRVVLVTRQNQLLEDLVRTAVRVGAIEGQILAPEAYDPHVPGDLFLLDGFVPPAGRLPRADTLLIRPNVTSAGDVAGFAVKYVVENPAILTWKREDPLMQYVELSEVRISSALLMERDNAAISLVSSVDGPLIAYKDFGSVRRYFLSFSPLVESNWWRVPSLLVFMQNIMEQTRQRHFIGMPQLFASGNPARLWNVGNEEGSGKVTIALPDGNSGQVAALDGAAEFGETDRLGFYAVEGAAGQRSLFAVNLLSPVESDVRPQSLQTPGGSNVEESTSVATVNKEIWRWLAAAALAILLLEWWAYHRRIA
jgi:hypothetical protein